MQEPIIKAQIAQINEFYKSLSSEQKKELKEKIDSFKNKSNSFLIEKPVTNNLEYLESPDYLSFHQNYGARECLMYFHHPIYRKHKKKKKYYE